MAENVPHSHVLAPDVRKWRSNFKTNFSRSKYVIEQCGKRSSVTFLGLQMTEDGNQTMRTQGF